MNSEPSRHCVTQNIHKQAFAVFVVRGEQPLIIGSISLVYIYNSP